MPPGAAAGGQERLEAPQSIVGADPWEAGSTPLGLRLSSEPATASHVSHCPLLEKRGLIQGSAE